MTQLDRVQITYRVYRLLVQEAVHLLARSAAYPA
jgi:hypothetical protein